jgi:hypothetical protein
MNKEAMRNLSLHYKVLTLCFITTKFENGFKFMKTALFQMHFMTVNLPCGLNRAPLPITKRFIELLPPLFLGSNTLLRNRVIAVKIS